ncbi:hypothetical protein [Lacticaseibacillus sharpeae]|uniref:Lipoprotein n=1 Tax=Lacticaseibacillus sharpeae JCM 1186 = DSM 20505 TaxID=1291052 RepID=A0A0R1ZIV7_9LACO|nr:hypothetical protein [Lacticaseibacillus sharpeae]KRM54797.1 hypothetical protein FC18_GL002213 [Lacticaseibacillus sharpeae JCM 1186 = DSM 20505]
MKKFMAIFAALVMAIILAACDEDSNVTLNSETDAQIGKKAAVEAKTPITKRITIAHVIDFDGVKIPLTTTYAIDKSLANNWRFTYQSMVDLKLGVASLPDNLQLVVNNVYANVSLVSTKMSTNGVRQDSLNQNYSTLPQGGVSINAASDYEIPFQVEGINQNETSMTVINGYGSANTSRVTESDLRGRGVQGGKLNVVWTLLVKAGDRHFVKTVTDRIGLPYAAKE